MVLILCCKLGNLLDENEGVWRGSFFRGDLTGKILRKVRALLEASVHCY